jgi:hypothetical protein
MGAPLAERADMIERIGTRIGTAAASGLSLFGIRAGWEQPSYEVVERLTVGAEVRRYGPRLAAETEVPGEDEEAKKQAFGILEGYLSGEGRERPQEIEMTAPVETATGAGKLRLRLFLPSRYTARTVPVPADSRVAIAPREGETLATLRFSGLADEATFAERARVLLAAVEGTDWAAEGDVTLFTYDPPWTLPVLRRNEVVVPVRPTSGSPSRASRPVAPRSVRAKRRPAAARGAAAPGGPASPTARGSA